MADITLPYTFTDGAIASADNVMDNFYMTSIGDSFSVLNGYLDDANRESSWGNLGSNGIRPRALSLAGMVGKTQQLDFFGDTFPTDVSAEGSHTPLPGNTINFYLEYAPTAIIFTWQICIVSGTTRGGATITSSQFEVDGTAVSSAERTIPWANTAVAILPEKNRVYSGHVLQTGLTAGWHTASLKLFTDATTLARVRVRNIKYVAFK
jgi:hypothetical protein